MSNLRPIILALPKGRILEEAAAVFARAGYDLSAVFADTRKLVHECGPVRVLVLRNSDVPTYVAHGAADAGVEAAAIGCNWSSAPIVDVYRNWRNPIVSRRTRGGDVDQVLEMSLA